MKYNRLILALLLVVAIMVSSCLGQIHFSPDWVPGKRSPQDTHSSLFDVDRYRDDSSSSSSKGSAYDNDILGMFDRSGQDVHTCTQEVNYRVLLDMAKILAREAKRIGNCMKGCS